MRIIINGDDFGFSEGQNLGIIKAHKEGILTSTTAMAGGPALSHGMALAKECPDLSIGVHLTLDALGPLSPLDRIPSLVDEHGKFVRFPMDRPLPVKTEEVYLEWTAQIEKIRSYGIEPTHLDGHHHMHLHPDVLKATTVLAKEYSLPIRLVPSYVSGEDLDFIHKERIQTFYGLTDFYKETVSEEYFRRFRENHIELESEVLEIMCHPAYLDDVILENSSYQIHRVKELSILVNPEVKKAVEAQQLTLGSVKDFFPMTP
ncbi:chitin disaccharide deacetylase [Proteiniclasticum sp.]|uniref:chitin disaccharide deacetylase n=1 Tax=Proteiniclasticum sp. TaxID=2053595 RepID=UPI00289CE5F1|nr:chitin disaccharide deacetylase [Proteiniclasticum sp.]